MITSNRFENAAAETEPYRASLLALVGDRDPLEILTATPTVLVAAVAGLAPDQEATPEAPGKWSVRQVTQHLVDAELVGAFRYRMVLAHDRPTIPGYDQDRWAERLGYADADLSLALRDFEVVRASNLRLLRRATDEDRRRVLLHTERGEESLDLMTHLFAGHDLLHLRQIARIRAAIGV